MVEFWINVVLLSHPVPLRYPAAALQLGWSQRTLHHWHWPEELGQWAAPHRQHLPGGERHRSTGGKHMRLTTLKYQWSNELKYW